MIRLRSANATACWMLLVYAATLLLPSEIAIDNQQVSYFWPASGIAVAIALHQPRWTLIALYCINFLALYRVIHLPAPAAIAAAGLVAEAATAAWLFRSVLQGRLSLSRRYDLYKFFVVSCTAPVIAASIGAATWCYFGIAPWERAQSTFICWWYGEHLGILFAGPIFFAGAKHLFHEFRAHRRESLVIFLCAAIVFAAVNGASPDIPPLLRTPLALLPLPFLYWAASRLGAAATGILLTLFAISLAQGVRNGYGPFSPVHSETRIIVLWAYGQLVGFTALFVASLRSERDDALEALRASEERYRQLVEDGPSVVYTFPHDNLMTLSYISPQVADLLGYSPEECCAARGIIAKMVHPDDLGRVAEEVREAWQQKSRMSLEYRLIRRDGAVRWVRDEATFLPATPNTPALWQGVLSDVTRHREINEEHRRTQELLLGIWNSSSSAIAVLDTQGQILMANPAAKSVLGYAPEELVGKAYNAPNWRVETVDGVSIPPEQRPFATIIRTGASITNDIHALVDERGYRHILAVEGAPLRDSEGKVSGVFTMAHDITDRYHADELRQSLEDQLRHAQRIEAVGQLAGGVAHDFNNLLQVMQGHTRLAMEETDHPEKREQHLLHVLNATEKAAALTSQLLAFGRRQALEKTDCDLNELVQDHLRMIRRVIGEHIHVECVPGHLLGNVRVDPSQIEQILLNLCLNARDAMPHGGRLVLELGNVVIGEDYCAMHAWARPGRYVLLTVADTGTGMDATTQSRIFEPFFTTKPQGQGTGLGLSVVHGIVQQHGGLIYVYSEPGIGTTFKLYFPVVERSAADIGPSLESTAPRGTGTVLLAEDEPNVRAITTLLLERAGYTVLAAKDGEEAVALFRHHQDEITFAMLDVVMPRMGGFQAHEAIAHLRPGIPTLFCSGYSGATINNGNGIPPGTHFLHKPYSYEQLLQKIAELHQA